MMDQHEVGRRRGLTFAEAEGIDPLPSQLKKIEISARMRVLVWDAIYSSYEENSGYDNGEWYSTLKNIFVLHYNGMSDDFNKNLTMSLIRKDCSVGNYIRFYGLLNSFYIYDLNPSDIRHQFELILEGCRAAYRLVEGVLVPVATDQEATSIKAGLANAREVGLNGAAQHLSLAVSAASSGRWADSVRESVHAIESAVRQIDGADSLAVALNNLARSGHIHGAMNEAFKRLYGWTSDEGGIRHALLEDGDARVTEADAMFMLGACASFVTYLTANARKAGLLKG